MARDPYKYFRIEARELLDQLGRGVLDLEREPASTDAVARLLRLAHTLKGAARVVKQTEIGELAHQIEGLLAPYRESGTFPGEDVNELLALVDRAAAHLGEIAPAALPAPQVVREMPSFEAQPVFAPRPDVGEVDVLLDGVTEAHVQLASLRREVQTLERVQVLVNLFVDQLASPRMQQLANGSSTKLRATTDELSGLVRGLGRSLAVGVDQVDRELRQVRETAERLRLLPVHQIFDALERTARDVADGLGARVVFEASGGEVRLDAEVLGVVQRALVQLVRNAVAHGIEPTAERVRAGKSPDGHVELRVSRRGNQVVFRCTDDGRGVDLEFVRRSARESGLSLEDAERLGTEELLTILMKGGLTTAAAVTTASGRGIGLDVVREATKRLGGELLVETIRDKGTSIDLTVPVSLSSLDALLVEAGGQTAAIPLEAVRRTLRLPRAELAREADGASILFDGALIPFSSLSHALHGRTSSQIGDAAVSAVVLEAGGALAAIAVDRFLGAETVMLRRLPASAPAAPIVAGASLDGEGNPQLVLDPEQLVAAAHKRSIEGPTAPAQRLPILVIDDSLTTRMLEQSILESAGYEVEVAVSAEEGFVKARSRRFALMLVDVEMPGMDGFTFVERTRADPELRTIPAILVTSRDGIHDRRRGEAVGASGYVVKSEFDQRQLLELIRKLLAA